MILCVCMNEVIVTMDKTHQLEITINGWKLNVCEKIDQQGEEGTNNIYRWQNIIINNRFLSETTTTIRQFNDV